MEKINFTDFPSEDTPINAENLNQMQNNIENSISGVVERGSNEKGAWIKFENGTMICCGRMVFEANANWTQETLFYKNAGSFEFPQKFIDTPDAVNVTFVGNGLSRLVWTACVGSVTPDKTGDIFAMTFWNANSVYGYIHVTAIGRWK